MSTAKRPIQIYLEEKQEKALRRLAKERKVSMAALLRRGADKVIDELLPPEKDPLFDLPLVAESGAPADGAENHDRYLIKNRKERK
jgi:hypothetical protein